MSGNTCNGDGRSGGRKRKKTEKVGFLPPISLISLHWKRQEGKLKICSRKNEVREITNCLHILGNEPYFQLLLFIISDLRKCPCPIRASRKNGKCPIRATFCPIRASRFGVNRPNFAKSKGRKMADRHKTQSRSQRKHITNCNHKTMMKQARSLSPWVGERTSSGGAGALSKEDEEIISRATSLPGNNHYSILRPKPSKRSCSERRWNREA